MKKIIPTIILLLIVNIVNAQIQSLEGPRFGMVYISASPGSTFLNGDLALDDIFDGVANYNDIAEGTFTSLYGWQFESRFADGGNVTGIVEWIALVGGMERGKFLPSLSSMVGARSASGYEFALGPNLSLSGISMVFGFGYNFKSGNLNIPVNIAFVPGIKGKYSNEAEYDYIYVDPTAGPDGQFGTADDVAGYSQQVEISPAYDIDYNTGSRVSITVGFNLTK